MQKIKRCIAVLCLLSLCFPAFSYGQVKTTKLKDIYLFKQGFLVGYSFQMAGFYPTLMVVNATHQIQWFQCKLPRATILLSPKGIFRIEEVSPNHPFSIQFNSRGLPSQIGKVAFKYDPNGRLTQFGQTNLTYHSTGRLQTFGRTSFRYRNDQKLSSVGSISLKYRAEGRIKSIGNLQFQYQANGKIGTVGNIQLTYDRTRNLLKQTTGTETRANIRVLWNTLQVNRTLKQSGIYSR